MWNDVKFLSDSVLIQIKQPKCRSFEGIFVDIFEFPNSSCCPVKALRGLAKYNVHNKVTDSLVFMFNNGTLLTPSVFNST